MLNSLTASLTQYIVTESVEEQDEKRELKKAMIGQWDSAYHLRTVKGELGPYRQFDQLLAPRLKIVPFCFVSWVFGSSLTNLHRCSGPL